MNPTAPESYSKFSSEDLKFLQTCLSVVTNLLENQRFSPAEQASIVPIIEDDGRVCEAQVDWTVDNSKLLMCLGRTETLPMVRFAGKGIEWKPVSTSDAKAVIQKATRVDPKVRDLMCRFINHLEEWGYQSAVASDNDYPIPTINFTKIDSAVGAITLIEVTVG